MSSTQSLPADDPCCGIVSGTVTRPAGVAPFDPMIDRARITWTAGDFARIAAGYTAGADAFVERLGLAQGETVLDVACGTGNLSLPAARRGAVVTGIDIAPNLIEAACRASAGAGLDIRFEVGTAEALPYAGGAFDTVISMFGVMFAARPELALAELVRVTRSGGRIVLANWAPDGFIGSMFRAHAAALPPPAGAPIPLAWGDDGAMRQRLATHSDRIRAARFVPRTIDLAFPTTPGAVVEIFREFYGPSVRTFAALDAEGRAALTAELVRLWSGRNSSSEGATCVAAEYLEVQIEIK